MNKTHKRELKKIPKRIKLKKEPTIIHPTDTYTITPVKYEKKKKKCQKFPTPRGQHLVHRYRIKKKRVEKEKKDFHERVEHGGQTIDSVTLLPFKRTRLRVNGSIER